MKQQVSMPYDLPGRIFSRFNPVYLIKPEAEVKWFHENIKILRSERFASHNSSDFRKKSTSVFDPVSIRFLLHQKAEQCHNNRDRK
jgi:hypothetical protein